MASTAFQVMCWPQLFDDWITLSGGKVTDIVNRFKGSVFALVFVNKHTKVKAYTKTNI